jgi:peptidoglycan/xylan/chitin deacetylase (PgdA/CDA1 family)
MAVAMIMSAKQTVKAGLARSRIFRVASRFLEPAVVILRYHSVQEDPSLVGDTIGSGITHSTVSFESEMRILASDFKVISLEDLLVSLRAGRSLARRSVVLTFDDGYLDNLDFAAPILEKYGLPACIYVVVSALDGRTTPWFIRTRHAFAISNRAEWMDSRDGHSYSLASAEQRNEARRAATRRLAKLTGKQQLDYLVQIEHDLGVEPLPSSACPMLSWDQARSLRRAGHLIGSHTVTHPNCAYIKLFELQSEFCESKRRIEEELGVADVHFSYPSPILQPHYTPESIEQSAQAGFRSAVTSSPGVVHIGDNPFSLKRVFAPLDSAEFPWVMENSFAGRVV